MIILIGLGVLCCVVAGVLFDAWLITGNIDVLVGSLFMFVVTILFGIIIYEGESKRL